MAVEPQAGALRALNEPPRRLWPDAVLHHGLRIALLLGLVFLFQLLFPVASAPDIAPYELGMVPQQDIIAEEGFHIPKSDAELAQEREEAAAAVAPVFRYDPTAQDTMRARVHRFMAHVDSAALLGGSEEERRERVATLLNAYGFPFNAEALDLLLVPRNRAILRASLGRAIEGELSYGVVSLAEYEDNPAPLWRLVREDSERLLDRDSVRTQSRMFGAAAAYLPAESPPGLSDFLRLVLIRFFEGNIKLDAARTNEAREQARQAVSPNKGEVLPGERVIAAHEVIREREMERLEAYRQHMRRTGAAEDGSAPYSQQLGTFLLNLMILSIFGVLLLLYRPGVYGNARHVLLIATLVAVLAGAAAAIGRTGAPVELVPIAFPVLVVAALWDGRMALNLALVLATLLSIQTPFLSMSARLLMLLGGAAAALSVRVVHRRSQGLVLGTIVALAYAVACLALGLLRSRPAGEILECVLAGAANGMASSLIAMGFLPLFEVFTRITTDQTLIELADLNRPLLKRLSLEASGTYAHSINVANLAEAAARAIGANALLARVGAYYHDVGKISMPQYFIENQARGRNPHDHLDPRRSAALVRSHVVEGIKLAEQAKLPESVRVFIPEHHGTQTIGFFYEQARQESPNDELDPMDFSYHGPRPRIRETAILMLADSVESAMKVLPDPTPERIRALVDRIVNAKIEQGQLDDAPLTLQDITTIKQQFTTVLSGMYHHRIDYPPPSADVSAPSVSSARE